MCATVWHHLVKATDVTASWAEINGSLQAGGWVKVTGGLTACTPGSAPGLTLGNEYMRIYLFSVTCHTAELPLPTLPQSIKA